MKKVSFLAMLFAAAVAMIVVSCQSGSDGSLSGYETAENGLVYKFHAKGDDSDSVTPKAGDFIDINMIYESEDSVIFNTDSVPVEQRKPIPMGKPFFDGDVFTGLEMMRVGDSATFVVSADSVWKYMYRGNIPPGLDSAKNLYYHIGLNDIISSADMDAKRAEEARVRLEEDEEIRAKFLAENYPDAQPTESGLYYIRTKKGKGKNPQNGQLVSVHYTGKLLDGTKFDSSVDRGTPYEFPLGQGRVIRGWDEGIAMMKKGEKGVLVIPSDLGYGSRGSGRIPPSSTLVFDVELVDFKDAE
jgi:peptidylprolyl isomerase